jgi:hypothetical protein
MILWGRKNGDSDVPIASNVLRLKRAESDSETGWSN